MLKTDRLLIRPWKTIDIDPYTELCSDPEVMRWIGDGSTKTKEECANAIGKFEEFWNQHDFGLFALELLENHQFIGFAGLSTPNFLPEVMPCVEIGWRLARSAWGYVFATEAAEASVRFGFKSCALNRIVGIHQEGNSASARIMQKLDMTPFLETIDPSCNRAVIVHELLS